jgi:hypothetical protein
MQLPDIDWAQWLENLALSALAGFAGLLGYTMRTLDSKNRPTLLRAILEAFSSGLIGFIVIMICRATNLDGYWTGAICGVMGWMGAPASIKLLEKVLKKRLGVTDDVQGATNDPPAN